MIRIYYSKQRLKQSLGMGIYFSMIGLIIMITGSIFSIEIKDIPIASSGFGLICAGIFHLILHLYEKQKQYLTIENGFLKKNEFLSLKKVNLNEVKQMKKFGGDYILKTGKNEFVIDTQIIDGKSLVVLDSELEKLNMEWS